MNNKPKPRAATSYFVNPSRNVLVGLQAYHFYPIANSEAFDTCEDIPKKETDDPLNICLLAAGDVRNILYTTYRRRQLSDKRKLHFYVNDLSSAIIAKDILLLQLAAKTPFDQYDEEINKHVELFLSLWADLALSENNRKALDVMLTHHLEEFTGTGEGCFITVPEPNHLWEIKKTWALWLTTTVSLAIAKDFRKKSMVPWHGRFNLSGQTSMDNQQFTSAIEGFMFVMDLTPTPPLKSELGHFYDTGTMLRPGQRHCLNVTMRDPQSGQLPQTTSYPFISYHNVSEPDDYLPAETHSLYRALHRTVKKLLLRFAREVSSQRVSVYFDVGDCNEFLAERLDSDVRFHAIDTSNMLDHKGIAALLTMTSLRINRQEPNSTIWTETIKSPYVYESVGEILENSLWIPYSILPTVFQLTCTLPFESCLDFSTELGRHHRKIYVTGIKFKWTPISHGTSHPLKIDLFPNSSSCVFRAMIDQMLETLCFNYTQAAPKFSSDFGFHPHSGLHTIPTMMVILLCCARQINNPQVLLDHLYERVAANAEFGMFSFEIQNIAIQMYPESLQPKSLLHPIFTDCSSEDFSLFFCTLEKRSLSLPCPVTSGALLNCLSERERRAMSSIEFNTKKWLTENRKRVQFIDCYTISLFPLEFKVRLPKKLVYPKSQSSILIFDLVTGFLVFEPVALSKLNVRHLVENNKIINLFPNNLDAAPCDDYVTLTQVHELKKSFVVGLKTTLELNEIGVKAGKHQCQVTLTTNDNSRTSMNPLPLTFPNYCHNHDVAFCKFDSKDGEIFLTLQKPSNSLKPKQQLLDLGTLRRWPNKPFNVNEGMFTMEEFILRRTGGRPFGNSYFEVRGSIADSFVLFTDEALGGKNICRMTSDGNQKFQVMTSTRKSVIGYYVGLFASPRGVPISEFRYVNIDEICTPHVIQRYKSLFGTKSGIVNVCLEEAIDFVKKLLQRNSDRLVNTNPEVREGISLKRSFFTPLFPKENKFGDVVPKSDTSFFDLQMNEWKQQRCRVHSPISSITDNQRSCYSCSTIEYLKVCSQCKTTWFCSVKCQKAGWKKHKINCVPKRN